VKVPEAIFAIVLLGHAVAAAGVADPYETRLKALEEELRCLVCQNQTLADSNAPLAVDLRNEIREMMEKGADDPAIIEFLTQRYGDFVRYQPPVRPSTLVLWFGPALLLAGAVALLVSAIRRHGKKAVEDGMPTDELDREIES
jgi:cytochrome c-type biogenesis protein CcmH